ncbi:btb/poz domain-containing [Anaeramoeba flamelloides]|uniref:Btb/poz domain-containing n=1 Tax=Anaeramoeba flamelloides TaxID=1746091 RepID=A0AAV7Z947_9EUKA|nr:btb/poz domain-containing [Anaeramoeba flamelloides]
MEFVKVVDFQVGELHKNYNIPLKKFQDESIYSKDFQFQTNSNISIVLPKTTGKIFAVVVNWVNSKKIQLNLENIFDVLHCSQYLGFQALTEKCIRFLLKIVSKSHNGLVLLKHEAVFNTLDLRIKIIEKIIENPRTFKDPTCLQGFTYNQLKILINQLIDYYVIKRMILNIPNFSILIKNWASHQKNQKKASKKTFFLNQQKNDLLQILEPLIEKKKRSSLIENQNEFVISENPQFQKILLQESLNQNQKENESENKNKNEKQIHSREKEKGYVKDLDEMLSKEQKNDPVFTKKKKKKKNKKKKEKEKEKEREIGIEKEGGDQFGERIGKSGIDHEFSRRGFRSKRRRSKETRYVLLLTTEKKNIPRNNIKASITFGLKNINLTTRLVQKGKKSLQIQELLRFDLIFFYSVTKSTINDSVNIGNQLASYVSDGGSLIICSVAALSTNKKQENQNRKRFAKKVAKMKKNNKKNSSTSINKDSAIDFTYKTTYLKGKIMENGFLPLSKGKIINGTHQNSKRAKINLKKSNLNHPILKNIKDFDGGRTSLRVKTQTLPVSETDRSETIKEIAQWDDGLPLISIKKKNPYYGSVCILNMCPVSGGELGYPDSWRPSSDGKLLISNTVKFLIEN